MMSTGSSRSPDSRPRPSTSHDAALQGASLAFSKPPLKPKPQAKDYSGRGAALAAANKASPPKDSNNKPGHEGADHPNIRYQSTGESSSNGRGGGLDRPLPTRLDTGSASSLLQSKSPSFIAATLAASRSVTPNHTGPLQSPAGHSQHNSNVPRYPPASAAGSSSRESLDQALDTTPIPPTTSLIDHFEKRHAAPSTPNTSSEGPDFKKKTPTNTMQRSQRVGDPQKSPAQAKYRSPSPSPSPSPAPVARQKPKPEIKSPKPISPIAFSGALKPVDSSRALPVSRTTSALLQKQVLSPKPPQPPVSPRPVSLAPRASSKPAPKPIMSDPNQRRTPLSATKPIPIPSKFGAGAQGPDDASPSSDDSFVSASDVQPSLPPRRNTAASLRPRPRSASSVTVDSLANAIVASSLASSRAASPAKSLSTPPLPPPSRRSTYGLFGKYSESSRTPSPGKGLVLGQGQGPQLRTTMRKPARDDEVEENEHRRARRHIMKKHPHKHHEGDRKRWRDELTERERKRYEAVWASNKGLYTSASFDGGYDVCNLVVRDIWSRSRLPPEVLEEAYALVDRRRNGALGKEEFVVGLWLIDQRLKGRKLPIRVTESVWRSVGILGGIKVKRAK